MLSVNEQGDRLGGSFYFNTELFRKSSVEEFARKFTRLLAAVSRDPKQRVESIELGDKVALPAITRVAR